MFNFQQIKSNCIITFNYNTLFILLFIIKINYHFILHYRYYYINYLLLLFLYEYKLNEYNSFILYYDYLKLLKYNNCSLYFLLFQ